MLTTHCHYLFKGVRCEDCGFAAHKRCSEHTLPDCRPEARYVKRMFAVDLTTLCLAHSTPIPPVVTKCINEVSFNKKRSNLRISSFLPGGGAWFECRRYIPSFWLSWAHGKVKATVWLTTKCGFESGLYFCIHRFVYFYFSIREKKTILHQYCRWMIFTQYAACLSCIYDYFHNSWFHLVFIRRS